MDPGRTKKTKRCRTNIFVRDDAIADRPVGNRLLRLDWAMVQGAGRRSGLFVYFFAPAFAEGFTPAFGPAFAPAGAGSSNQAVGRSSVRSASGLTQG